MTGRLQLCETVLHSSEQRQRGLTTQGTSVPARTQLHWSSRDCDSAFKSGFLFLRSSGPYVSHYKPPQEHDSALESEFAERFAKLDTFWTLEREVDLVLVPGGVILPDFQLVNGERSVLVEIVGYWRPEYLRKKFALLRKSGRTDVIVCVSERLNLDKAGVDPSDFGARLVWFKGVLDPKAVLAVAEQTAQTE